MYLVFTASKDTYITNKIINSSTRATDANLGAASTLDLFKLYDETKITSIWRYRRNLASKSQRITGTKWDPRHLSPVTYDSDDLQRTLEIIKSNNKIKSKEISYKNNVSKISIVGAGMVTTPGVTYKMFKALAEEKINILAISTSEIKISVIIEEVNTIKAIKKLHTIFDLD